MRNQFMNAVLVIAGVCAAVSGCGSDQHPAPPSSSATTSMGPQGSSPAPGGSQAVGISPGGVTTKVDVPSAATESQFGQACHAATEWMQAQHTDPATLVEPYLKTLQQPGATGAGTFGQAWAALTPAQQSGVIMAAEQAARGECG